MKILSSIVLAIWAVTLLRTIVNLLLVPRLSREAAEHDLSVSVIVPARDEERSIARTVMALLAQTHRRLEVIVVDDRSADATGVILTDLARHDSRLTVVTGVEPPDGWLGKPWALHQGSLRATGELLLFVDADVFYAPEAVSSAVDAFTKSSAAMISLLPRFELRGFWEHVIMPNLAVVAFSVLPLWLANRSRIPWLAVGGGPGNLLWRADYDAAGGHESLRDAVIDDVALARMLRRRGMKTTVVRADDLIAVRMYHGLGEIVRGFTKNAFAVFGYRLDLVIVGVLFSGAVNVLPYVLAFSGDPFGVGALLLLAVSRLILYTSLRYGVLNAVFAHPVMMGSWFFILLRSVWFTGIRRQLVWRGRTYDARRTRFGAD